ncbi:unnamed protein product [Mesocestoides corti]|uniref:Cyclic nucleotide-binding domain-containing protein n=1 Tax=Mesocestoides corti TaxID=53468 RepID=A0A0R3UQZ4_MESCO|nr:unnamed protein product [Mesocestoides corti]
MFDLTSNSYRSVAYNWLSDMLTILTLIFVCSTCVLSVFGQKRPYLVNLIEKFKAMNECEFRKRITSSDEMDDLLIDVSDISKPPEFKDGLICFTGSQLRQKSAIEESPAICVECYGSLLGKKEFSVDVQPCGFELGIGDVLTVSASSSRKF